MQHSTLRTRTLKPVNFGGNMPDEFTIEDSFCKLQLVEKLVNR